MAAMTTPIDPHIESISLSEFQKDPEKAIRAMRAAGQPVELTDSGLTTAVLQDAASYRALIKRVERLELLESLREGMAAHARGESRPFEEAMEEIRLKHGLPK